jgi:small subunit ribosomal protein S14
MAKRSKIVRDEYRRAVVARYAQRRAELKEIIRSHSSTAEQRATRVSAPAPRRQRGTVAQPRLRRRASTRAPAQIRAIEDTGPPIGP